MTDPVPAGAEQGRVGRGLVSGTAWTAIHVAVSVPVAFVVNVVVARRLGVLDYGQLAILTMILSLATTAASMGVGAALMQFATVSEEAGRRSETQDLVRGAQGYNIFVAAPIVALVVALAVDVPPAFMILAIMFGVFAPALLQVGPIMLASQHRSDRAAQIAIVSNLCIQLAVVVTVLLHPTTWAVWVARIVATGALMVLPFLVLPLGLRRSALRPRGPWSLPRSFWLFAVPTGLATMISTLVTDRVQIFFLEWLGQAAAVGLFALAFGLAAQILAPVQAAVGPLLPAFAALRARGSEHARSALVRVARVASLATGAVVAIGVPALAGLVPWIYGHDYGPSADYFVVMACSAGVVVVGSSAYASLMSRLKGTRYLQINLVALVVMAAVAAVAVPQWAAWGAVSSLVAGTLTRAGLMIAIEARHYAVDPREMVMAFLPLLASIAAVLIVWFFVCTRIGGGPWQTSLGGASASFAAFVLVVRLTGGGLSSPDRDALTSVLPARLRPLGELALSVLGQPRAGE